jgi:hypothetical protein
MKRDHMLDRRVVFKLHGMEPLDAVVLKKDATGYWIRGDALAGERDQFNCSLPESDVRYLEFTRIEWVRARRQRPA